MKVYLDAADLIRLAERQSDKEFEQTLQWLTGHGLQLVVSMSNIMECCVPLTQSDAQTSVMRMLGRLERGELRYLAEAKIHEAETISAFAAFKAGGELAQIDPYVARFDEVVSPFSPPATKDYLRYGLAQTVFELWQASPDLFRFDRRTAKRLQDLRRRDRARDDYLRHDLNFPRMIERTVRQYGVQVAAKEIEPFAKWVWADALRCPGLRLGYETFHQIVRNKYDKAGETDMGDLSHLGCLPYVDAMTLDRRMAAYVKQSDRALGTRYSDRVWRNFEAFRKSWAA